MSQLCWWSAIERRCCVDACMLGCQKCQGSTHAEADCSHLQTAKAELFRIMLVLHPKIEAWAFIRCLHQIKHWVDTSDPPWVRLSLAATLLLS